jgi:hypothetical protein
VVDEGVAVGTATGNRREVGTGRTLRRPAAPIFLCHCVSARLHHCPGDTAIFLRPARRRLWACQCHQPVLDRRSFGVLLKGRDRDRRPTAKIANDGDVSVLGGSAESRSGYDDPTVPI